MSPPDQALEGLPAVDNPRDELVLAGFLLRGNVGALRLVSGHLCLELAAEDVLAVEEQPFPEGLGESLAIPVELRLRPGARLLAVSPSDMYASLLIKEREPFALAVR